MPITLPAGFNITNTDPVDKRFTVADQAARLAFSAANVYNGLLVFQRDTNELYVLKDTGSYNSNAGWLLVGSGSGGTVETGSLLTTGSVSLNTLTFTKGDGSTFALTVDTGSGGGGAGCGNGGNGVGGAGGSGVVILRILSSIYSGNVSGSPTVTTDGDYKVIKYTGSGTYVG